VASNNSPDSPTASLQLSDEERRLLDNASPVDREFRVEDLLQQLTNLSEDCNLIWTIAMKLMRVRTLLSTPLLEINISKMQH